MVLPAADEGFGLERALREQLGEIAQAVEQLEFDPHWFRRAFHAFGACFVVYYLLPDQGATMAFVKQVLPVALFAGALGIEAYRILGGLPTEAFFGLREYERFRVSGYVYFASAVVLLLYVFPPAIAAGCIVGAAIGDPILGEFRRARRERLGWLAAGLFIALVFLILGWHPAWAALAACVMVAAELAKNSVLDDDFMMPVVTAAVLVALQGVGALALLGGVPDSFPVHVEVPAWLP
jgi:dolichol kinase